MNLRVDFDFIVTDNSDRPVQESSKDILITCTSIAYQQILPKSVIVVTNNPQFNTESFKKLISELDTLYSSLGVKIKFINSLEGIPVEERLTDLGAKEVRHIFFSSWTAGKLVPKDFILKLMNTLQDGTKFIMINPSKDYNRVFSRILYQYVGGYRDGYAEEIIENMAKKEGNEHLVLEWKDINESA